MTEAAQTITQADVGQIPASVIDGATGAPAKRAPASNFLPIVRGRLPLLFVHAIRFDPVLSAMGNKDLATKFATSVGKVFDIKKGRNFAYVTQDFKPAAEDVKAAEDWIAQVGAKNAKGLDTSGDKTLMQTTLDAYKTAGLATAAEVAAFSASRGATRTKAAPATGAAQSNGAVAAEGVQTAAAGSADDLLN